MKIHVRDFRQRHRRLNIVTQVALIHAFPTRIDHAVQIDDIAQFQVPQIFVRDRNREAAMPQPAASAFFVASHSTLSRRM